MHGIIVFWIPSCHLPPLTSGFHAVTYHVLHLDSILPLTTSCTPLVLQASDLLNLSVDDPELIDPRELVNVYGLNAAQLAAHLHYRRLARMLLPQLSVLQLFEPEDIDRLVR